MVTQQSHECRAREHCGSDIGRCCATCRARRAIEHFYGVQVESVRTLVVRGKVKRFGRHFGKRKNWKKAYVTLTDGNSINIYE